MITLAKTPDPIRSDLGGFHVLRTFHHSTEMPTRLQNALAKLFKEPKLFLSEPGQPLQDELFIQGVSRKLPRRRFVFGFETNNYYYVYLERGAPAVCAYLIAFAKTTDRRPEFVWAGADLNIPFARDAEQLRRRVSRNQLLDHDPAVW